MSDHYRINVRFDMSKERERTAAEYLGKLSEKSSGTRNRFIVNAIIEAIGREKSDGSISLDDIRAMFLLYFAAHSLNLIMGIQFSQTMN